jgi:hypothetical protein
VAAGDSPAGPIEEPAISKFHSIGVPHGSTVRQVAALCAHPRRIVRPQEHAGGITPHVRQARARVSLIWINWAPPAMKFVPMPVQRLRRGPRAGACGAVQRAAPTGMELALLDTPVSFLFHTGGRDDKSVSRLPIVAPQFAGLAR